MGNMSRSKVRQQFTDLSLLALSPQLGDFVSQILGWGFIEPHWWRNYPHSHSFFEVCFAFEGQGTFRIKGTDYQVQVGDVFVAKPGESHEIVSSDHNPLGVYFWSYTLVPPSGSRRGSSAADTFWCLD